MVDDRVVTDVAELVSAYYEGVYRYAYRLTGTVSDAEDLTQQVFLVAQRKLDQLRRADAARAWLFAILRNLFFKLRQKKCPVPVSGLELDIESVPEETPHADWIDREKIQKTLDLMPQEYRLVLVMFYFEECSYREIAAQLDIPIGTVMSRLARAKAKLRVELFGPNGSGVTGCSSASAEPKCPKKTLAGKQPVAPGSGEDV